MSYAERQLKFQRANPGYDRRRKSRERASTKRGAAMIMAQLRTGADDGGTEPDPRDQADADASRAGRGSVDARAGGVGRGSQVRACRAALHPRNPIPCGPDPAPLNDERGCILNQES
jgi:hypothetical protein